MRNFGGIGGGSAWVNAKAEGFAYVATLFILVIIVTLGTSFVTKVGIETSAVFSQNASASSRYLAESAANHAMWRLLNEPAFPANDTVYYMHSYANGRYGYKVRRHTDTTFATIAAVGSFGGNVAKQSYVAYVKPPSLLTTGKVYWANVADRKIQRSDPDGSNILDLVTGLGLELGDIEVDILAGKVYWTEKVGNTKSLKRANLDGSSIEDVVTGLHDLIGGIALDVAAGKVYWGEGGTVRKIRRANLNGSNVEDMVSGLFPNLDGVTIDASAGKVYWTDTFGRRIQRANLDGSNVEDVVTGLGIKLGDIEVDTVAGKFYWVEKVLSTTSIKRANLDGTGIEDVVTGLNDSMGGLALDVPNGKLYWGEGGTVNKIRQANLDGTNITDIVTGLTGDVGGVTFV